MVIFFINKYPLINLILQRDYKLLKNLNTDVYIGYNEQKFVGLKVSESFAELENYDQEDQEEGREIEVETEREETYVRD